MTFCQDKLLIDLMLLSFQPSKTLFVYLGFGQVPYNKMFSASLVIGYARCVSNEIERMRIEKLSLSVARKESEKKKLYSWVKQGSKTRNC